MMQKESKQNNKMKQRVVFYVKMNELESLSSNQLKGRERIPNLVKLEIKRGL